MVLNMKLETLGWYQSDHQLRQYQLITVFSIPVHNTNGNIDEQWSLFRTALAKSAAGVFTKCTIVSRGVLGNTQMTLGSSKSFSPFNVLGTFLE